MAEETKDVVILQIKIDEGTGKKLPQAKKEVEALAGSIMGLTKTNKELRAERNKVDLTTEAGRKKVQELNEIIDKNNIKIKENTSALEKQRMNIGNYGSALDKLMPGLGNLVNGQNEVVASLTGAISPITAVIAGVGALFAAYVKSTAGANDFAFAQSRVSFMLERVTEAFGSLVGGTGAGGTGPLSKMIDLMTHAALQATGLELILGRLASKFLDESKAAAQAVETLKDLEISRAFAQAAFKDSEKQAELQRRIRDDTTKTLKERLEASRKIDEIMAAAGQRTTIVIQAQIDAIKASTVNYNNNREAQLKVAQLMGEISDVQEDVIGKTTENVMAVKALNQSYKDLVDEGYKKAHEAFINNLKERKEEQQRINDELAALDPEYFERRNEQSKKYHDAQIEQLNETHRQEIEAQQQQNEDLAVYYDKDAEAKKQAEEKKREEARRSANEAVDYAQNIADSLNSITNARTDQEIKKVRELEERKLLTKRQADRQVEQIEREGFQRNKKLAVVQTLVNTAQAVIAAFAPPPTGAGPVFGPIFAAIAAVTGAIQLSAIRAQQFALGGEFRPKKYAYGGPIIVGGRSHAAGGTTYRGEDGNAFEVEKGEGIYVMKKSAQEDIKFMSSFNEARGGKSWTGQPSWYAAQGGQIETRTFASQLQERRETARLIAHAVANLPAQILTVEAFDAVANAKYNAEKSVQILP